MPFLIDIIGTDCYSMATVGVNTNGSQFYISLSPTQYLNGRCVVFGRLVGGEDVLARMEKVRISFPSLIIIYYVNLCVYRYLLIKVSLLLTLLYNRVV